MAFLTAEQEAALNGQISAATLVEMQFASGPMYLWNGAGTRKIGGISWQGTGALGSVENLKQIRSGESAKFTLKLSGVDADVLLIARNERDEVRGRFAFLWQQLFDEHWQEIGGRIPLVIGVMQRLVLSKQETATGSMRVAALECENPFAGRDRAPYRRFTDADHQARFPGDRFCRWVSQQVDQRVTWPDF